MEKSRGLFAEDFGPFMRPGGDALGFSSKLKTISEQLTKKEALNDNGKQVLVWEPDWLVVLENVLLKCNVCFH